MFQDLEGLVILMTGVLVVGFGVVLGFFLVGWSGLGFFLVHILDNPESRFVYLANVMPYEK